MKPFFKTYENYFWLLLFTLIVSILIITVNRFTETDFVETEHSATFLGSGYKSSSAGKSRTIVQFCRFWIKGQSKEYISQKELCRDLQPNQKVKIKLKNKYAKFSWQKDYVFKGDSLVGITPLKDKND